VIKVARKPNSMDVIETLNDLFRMRGVPAHSRSDQGPEFGRGEVSQVFTVSPMIVVIDEARRFELATRMGSLRLLPAEDYCRIDADNFEDGADGREHAHGDR
jgi:hypothetical protein